MMRSSMVRFLAGATLGFAFTVSMPVVMACDGSGKDGTTAKHGANTNKAALTTTVINVSGMACSEACPMKVKTALTSLEGVSTVAVNFETKQVSVEYEAGKVSVDSMIAKLKELGYGASVSGTEAAKRQS